MRQEETAGEFDLDNLALIATSIWGKKKKNIHKQKEIVFICPFKVLKHR